MNAPRFVSSLRWRLSSAISGAILLGTVACITASVLFLNQALTNRAQGDLARTLAGVGPYLQSTRTDLIGQARLVADDPVVPKLVSARDGQTLGVYLIRYFADLNVDVLDVTDQRGEVITRSENLQAPTSNVSWMPTVRAALRGGRASFALESDERSHGSMATYALRATVPIRSGSAIIGTVIVGRLLDNTFAQRIQQALSANVNLIVKTERAGSTLTDDHGLPVSGLTEPKVILNRIATNRTTIARVTEPGGTALSGIVPIPGNDGRPAGAIEVISMLSPLYGLIANLSLLLVALGATVIGAGTLAALAISKRLTSRLQLLESRASEVAELASTRSSLNQLRGDVAVGGDDEVASLARSFSSMMAALDRRLDANEQLYAAAQARVRELSSLASIARLLTAGPSIRDTLHLLGEEVCQLVGCSAVAIWLPREGGLPAVYGGHGLPEFYGEVTSLGQEPLTGNAAETASERALIEGRIVHGLLSYEDHPFDDSVTDTGSRVSSLGWGSATAVPLPVGDRIVGVLTCYRAEPFPMSESDTRLLRTIADQVAVAVENARLYRQSRDLATLQERARLARDLHDSVTQALFSMTMHTRAAQIALSRSRAHEALAVSESLDQIADLTHGALAEMRALIFELRPDALAEEGLATALRKQAVVLTMREHLNVYVNAPAERIRLEEHDEEHLYRLSLEALNNIVKHARASTVVIELTANEQESSLMLEIRDDGDGFDLARVPPGHLGLGTMSERARLIGGKYTIESAIGKGTTVRVCIPLPAQSATAHRSVESAAG